MIRRTLTALGALLVVATSFVARAPSASATEVDKLTITEGQTIKKHYGPIPATDPATDYSDPDLAENCEVLPSCDLIRLKVVVPPSVGKDEDFFVRVSVDFISQQVKNPATGEAGSNDLDLFIWSNPKGKKYETHSSTGYHPERASLDRPRKGNYDIMINNYAGANQGLDVTVEWISGRFDSPFENLEPGRSGSGGASGAIAAPKDLSDVPDTVTRPPDSSGVPFDAGSFATGVDADFSGLDFGTDAALTFDPKKASDIFSQSAQRSGPPRPVTDLSLWLAFGVTPVALLAAGGWWFLAHRPAALLVT